MYILATSLTEVKGRGAEYGWISAAIALEEARMDYNDYVVGGAGMYKYFDQQQRPLIYALAERTGMPKVVLNTYRANQEIQVAKSSLAGGLGQPYNKKASMPQGDPLSMALIGACHGSTDGHDQKKGYDTQGASG